MTRRDKSLTDDQWIGEATVPGVRHLGGDRVAPILFAALP